MALFEPEESPQLGAAKASMGKSRNKQLAELFDCGIGIHHAGMLRSDRNLVEKLFGQGHIKVRRVPVASCHTSSHTCFCSIFCTGWGN